MIIITDIRIRTLMSMLKMGLIQTHLTAIKISIILC